MDGLNDLSPTLAYLFAGSVVFAIFLDIRQDLCRLVSGRNVVLIGIASWYLLEAIMLPDFLRKYDQESYNLGLLYVALAFGLFLLGYHYTSGCSLFTAMGGTVKFFDDETSSWRLILLGAAIGFAPVVYNVGTDVVEMFQGILGMRSTWGGLLGRGRYGDARAAFLMLEMFVGGVAPFAGILLFSRTTTLFQRLFCILVIAWPMLRAYGSGTRSSMIISVGCSLLAVLYWKATPVWRKRFLIAVLVSAPLIYGLMAAIVASRGTAVLSWEAGSKTDYVGNEMFRELLFIISKVPSEFSPFQYGYTYYVQLVNPIPRFLWPDKPTLDTGLLLATLQGQVDSRNEAYLTISPGLIGEMYLNFGVLGIIALSFFGGWLVKGWDRVSLDHGQSLATMMFYSGGLGVLFILGRSFTMNMFYGLLSLVLLAFVIRYFSAPSSGTIPASQT